MITVTIAVASTDALLGLAQKLAGVNGVTISNDAAATTSAPKKAAKEATPTEKGKEATKSAAPKKDAKREVSLSQLQDKIGEHADGDTDKIKEFIKTFGHKKISQLSDEERVKAFDQVEEYFGGEAAEGDDEEDPMS